MDTKMEPVINFTNELFTLVENKIPISKAKMGAITKSAMKAIKFYKHVVQNVEKFILKCSPQYKIPGLYVIDSIVRQSRHQFGPEKDVFAPRFARNMEETFAHLFRCSQEDKSKIIRVLNLWQKNNVFAPEVIQPLFDLANPDHPVHQAFMQQQQQQNQQGDIANGINVPRESPSQKEEQASGEALNALNIQKFQYQQLMMQQQQQTDSTIDPAMKFNNQLLDYDYGSDGDENKGEAVQQHQMLQPAVLPYAYNFTKCLEDPTVLKHLQNIKQMDVQRYLNEMPGVSGALLDPQQSQATGITLANINNLRGPPQESKDQDVELVGDIMPAEIIPVSSRSPTPNRHKRRKSRSRSRDKNSRYGRRRRSRSKSRSRSYSRSPRGKRRSSRDRAKEKEREVDRERKRKGLPDIKKEHLSVCSTTLWVGHLSKLVQQEELSDTFGKYGDIVSIDMIPPRGCAYIVMNRRQDAYKAMQSLKSHKMQNRAITISWAAGKGVKSKEWKDYFDQGLGVTYIPFGKLTQLTDFVSLEEGGMYDEDSMPAWVKEKIKQQNQPAVSDLLLPQFFPAVDTSQPPPSASLLPTMPPGFPLGARPMLMGPGLMGLSVPPPPGMPMLPGMLQIPPGLMGFPMAAAAAAATQQNLQGQTAGDDHMDIEMEDETSAKTEPMMQFYNQPPPMNMNAMMMGGQEKQGESHEFNNRMSRNNRSQSRERDGRGEFRSRGPRDRNDRRSGQDYNRNSRWPNDSNGRERSRSRDGQNNFNRRQGHQNDIPSLMSSMPMMDNDGMPQRQRNNDYGRDRDRDDYDRRGGGGFSMRGGRGFNDMRGGRGGRGGGQFQRGGMRGFHNNNFNDRGGNFHDRDRDSGPRGRGGRNWRDEDNDRRSFSNNRNSGSFERKGSRWMDNQKNDDEWNGDEQQKAPQAQQSSSEQQEQSSSFDNGNGSGNGDFQDAPPGTEDNQRFDEPTNEPAPFESSAEAFDSHSQGDASAEPASADNAGNTTPLCDEAEAKD